MRIVTAANNHGQYRRMIELGVQEAKKLGYEYMIFDLGGLELGVPYEEVFNEPAPDHGITICWAKPKMILRCLLTTKQPVLWADADCIILQPLDLPSDSYDMAFRVRDFGVQPIQAGVLFFNNTEKSRNFLKKWIDSQPTEKKPEWHNLFKYGDQIYLNRLITQDVELNANMAGEIITLRDGERVRLLDKRYNDYGGQPTRFTKILHFKSRSVGAYREEFEEYVRLRSS